MATYPWTEKYRPRRVADVVGNEEAKSTFISWLKSWFNDKPTKKAVLLYGPPGVGKTTLVHAAAHEYGLEVIEANASDVRTSQALKRSVLRAATEGSLTGYKGKIILMDEVDGIEPSADRGGLRTLLDLIEGTRVPVVLTANDPWDPKLRELRSKCLLMEFKPIHQRDIIKVLKKICDMEGIKADREVLREIARRAEGDLRAAINDLQAIAEGRRSISLEDLGPLSSRSKQYNMFEIVRKIFFSRSAEQARAILAIPSLDYEMLFQWINENIPLQYQGSIEAIAEAYDALSKADIYFSRIKRNQEWSLLPYALELMTAGVALVKHKPKLKFTKYSFPQRLKLLSMSKEKRELRERMCSFIASKCHVSRALANTEILPFIGLIYKYNRREGVKILKWLGISERSFKELIGS